MEFVRKPTRPMKPRPPGSTTSLLLNNLAAGSIISTPSTVITPSTTSAPPTATVPSTASAPSTDTASSTPTLITMLSLPTFAAEESNKPTVDSEELVKSPSTPSPMSSSSRLSLSSAPPQEENPLSSALPQEKYPLSSAPPQKESSPSSQASIISTSSNSSTGSRHSLKSVEPLPSPVSPLPPTPPLPTWNQPTSEKLKQLNSLRKYSFLPSKLCSYIFKKGEKRGEQCTKSCLPDEVLCSLHLKLKDKKNTLHSSQQTVGLHKTRINKLRRYKKYFFVKVIGQTTIRLRCEDKEYILKLPRGMVNPITPTKEHYLIRKSNGKTVWRKLIR